MEGTGNYLKLGERDRALTDMEHRSNAFSVPLMDSTRLQSRNDLGSTRVLRELAGLEPWLKGNWQAAWRGLTYDLCLQSEAASVSLGLSGFIRARSVVW